MRQYIEIAQALFETAPPGIKLFETVTPQLLTQTIEDTAKEYIDGKLAPNVYEINNGHCEAFAIDVVNKLGGDTPEFFTIDALELCLGNEEGDSHWDVKLIRKLFPKSRPTHGLTWKDVKYDIPSHVWIVFNKRHYDAEAPQGVDNFFELPLIRRGMESMSNQKSKSLKEWMMLVENPEQLYYHVTTKDRLRSIMAHGIQPGRRRRWNNAFGVKLGDTRYVYIGSDYFEAIAWAAKAEWQLQSDNKPHDMVILVLKNVPGEIEKDPHIEGQISHRGTWYQVAETIPSQCIIKTVPLTTDLKRQLIKARKEGKFELDSSD